MLDHSYSITLETFGRARLQFGDNPESKTFHLRRFLIFAYLAERGEAQSREKLAVLLWPDAQPSQRQQSLRSLLARMKSDGVSQYLNISRKELDLADRGAVKFDLAEIRKIAGDFNNCELNDLQDLFNLCHGEFLESLNLDDMSGLSDWAYAIQHEVETILCQAYLLMTPRLIAAGAAEEAIQYGRKIIELAPYDDELRLLYTNSLIANGQIAEALQELTNYRRVVNEIYPNHRFSKELLDLGAQLAIPGQLARHLAEPIRATCSGSTSINFKSMWNGENYLIRDQALIGRDVEVSRLQKFLDRGFRLVSVTGADGIGKSFFIRSQIPTLRARFDERVSFVDCQTMQIEPAEKILGRCQNLLLQQLIDQLKLDFDQSISSFDQVMAELNGELHGLPSCLILENFESIYSEAKMVGKLLDRIPNLTILAISQRELNLSRECLLPIREMPVSNQA